MGKSGTKAGLFGRALALAGVGLALGAVPARAQLSPGMVLVVYDSRIPDSLAVAEIYAGSASVAGGAGGEPGTRPGVRVVDLASLGAPAAPTGNITYADFVARVRDPLRSHLASGGLARAVRCLVLTKGLPHRVQDTDNANIGDNPGTFVNEFTGNDVTCASVDSELTLLWQDLSAGEAGGSADSRSDGMIVNPYWRSSQGIGSWSTSYITSAKGYTSAHATGPVWRGNTTTGAVTGRILPGDVYLVCRLDGRSVADVRGALLRGVGARFEVEQQAVLFDEDPGDLDNNSGGLTSIYSGNDYTLATGVVAGDGRVPAAGTISGDATIGLTWNTLGGAGQFLVGPRLAFTSGQGVLVTAPVALLATYGANHQGVPTLAAGGSANTTYATSFWYGTGAVFNTIESYNARDLGGLGQNSFAPQQQAADFLAAGGTFAIGHVWEPLAPAVADNEYLVRNFLLGGLSWGEAAWSSIPVLSWQHVVLGDPLARLTRSCDDADADNTFGVDDLHAWSRSPTDLNRDSAIGEADRLLLVRSLRQGERGDLLFGRP